MINVVPYIHYVQNAILQQVSYCIVFELNKFREYFLRISKGKALGKSLQLHTRFLMQEPTREPTRPENRLGEFSWTRPALN